MTELVVALLTWIAGETGLAMPHPPPVAFVTEGEISELAYGRASESGDDVRALYDREAGTVYLRDDWNPDDLRSRATLLHELVHHVQTFNRITYECSARREPMAYDLSVKWLREQGAADPFAILNTDQFTIMVMSTCPDTR